MSSITQPQPQPQPQPNMNANVDNNSTSSNSFTSNNVNNINNINITPNADLDTSTDSDLSATPTLKVMRLQAPSLGQPHSGGSLGGVCPLNLSLRLPDSFGVIHVGETFSAYLGALNTSTERSVTNLKVKAALQTPTTRHALPSVLDVDLNDNSSSDLDGFTIPPTEFLSAMVSRTLEEVGPHVLRVEVKFSDNKSIRKYYRFNVSSPLSIRECTVRAGEDKCFVSIGIENVTATSPILISSADFEPPMNSNSNSNYSGFTAKLIQKSNSNDHNNNSTTSTSTSTVQQFDDSGYLPPGSVRRYLFLVSSPSSNFSVSFSTNENENKNINKNYNKNKNKHNFIAQGDELGKAVFAWKKNMGEQGRIASMSVLCPASFHLPKLPPDSKQTFKSSQLLHSASNAKFVMHSSGLKVDVAKDMYHQNYNNNNNNNNNNNINKNSLSSLLPVTVEPIHPPTEMPLAQPHTLQLLITNHSPKALHLQLQFRLPFMSGAVICGPSFQNIGILNASGASTTVEITLVALVAGLFRCTGCWVVDLETGLEIMMPSLFNVFVHKHLHLPDTDTDTNTEQNLDLTLKTSV